MEQKIELLKDRLSQRIDNDSEEIKAKYMTKSKEDIYNDSFKLAVCDTFGEFLNFVIDNLEEDDEELLDCQGYKEKETIGSTSYGIKKGE